MKEKVLFVVVVVLGAVSLVDARMVGAILWAFVFYILTVMTAEPKVNRKKY